MGTPTGTFSTDSSDIIILVAPTVDHLKTNDTDTSVTGVDDSALTTTLTRTITYTVSNGVTAPASVTQTITLTRESDYNEATKVVTYSNWKVASGNVDAISSPDVPGYTPVIKTVLAGNIDFSSKIVPVPLTNLNVPYLANTNTQNIVFKYKENTVPGGTTNISGKTGDSIDFTQVTPPDGYHFLGTPTGTFSTDASDINILVAPNVDHVTINDPKTATTGVTTTDLTTTLTRTITYTVPNGVTAPTKVDQTVTLTREADYNEATKVVTYSNWSVASGNVNAMTSPDVPGYTPVVKTVLAGEINLSTKNVPTALTDLNVPYLANTNAHNVVFTEDGNPISGGTKSITGKTGDPIDFTKITPPDGYHFVGDPTGTFGTGDEDIVIKVEHNIVILPETETPETDEHDVSTGIPGVDDHEIASEDPEITEESDLDSSKKLTNLSNSNSQSTLPQTGEEDGTALNFLGIVSTLLAGSLILFATRRRKDKE